MPPQDTQQTPSNLGQADQTPQQQNPGFIQQPAPSQPPSSVQQLPKKPSKKTKIIAGIVLCVLIVLGIVIFFVFIKNNRDQEAQELCCSENSSTVQENAPSFTDNQDKTTGAIVFSPINKVEGWTLQNGSKKGSALYSLSDNSCQVEFIQQPALEAGKARTAAQLLDALIAESKLQSSGEATISSAIPLMITNEAETELFRFEGKKIVYTSKQDNTNYTQTFNAYGDGAYELYVSIKCKTDSWQQKQGNVNNVLEKGVTSVNRVK
jgi:hypothetical protein